jgi:hypothetical protein
VQGTVFNARQMKKVREVEGLGEREEKMTKERWKEGGRATSPGE